MRTPLARFCAARNGSFKVPSTPKDKFPAHCVLHIVPHGMSLTHFDSVLPSHPCCVPAQSKLRVSETVRLRAGSRLRHIQLAGTGIQGFDCQPSISRAADRPRVSLIEQLKDSRTPSQFALGAVLD